MRVVHFAGAAEFRAWLEEHHGAVAELQVGFYKKSSGKSGLTYFEAVEEALCFGWIDGIIRRVDDERYTHRFTPRRRDSTWSLVNVAKVKSLLRKGRMHEAGIAAFRARKEAMTGVYHYERKGKRPEFAFSAGLERLFRADRKGWDLWRKSPPGYRKTATRWVMSAKQPATQERRLRGLIAITRAGRRLGLV